MPAVLPKGVKTADFQRALERLRKIVGAEWLFSGDDPKLAAYRDDYSAVPSDLRVPSAAICAGTLEEIQAVLAVANEFHLPLWAFGNGKNYAYGGPAPREQGFLILDLKRMNRILEVNEELAYALVEPGVSYFQLHEHLRSIGSKLWVDCPAPGWGGVMGNTLEHGAGYTPYGDHFIMQCGMEVVLADGMVVRTGMGAMPKSTCWQLFKYGYGPWVDGLFTQSNYGVVTKMGLWLMPEPPGYKPFMITVPREEDLHQVIEIMRPLKMNMVIPNGAVVAHALYDGAVQVSRAKYHSGKGPMPESAVRKIASDLDLGMWNLYGALYGLPDNVELIWTMVRDAYASIPGTRFFLKGDRAGDPGWEYREMLMRGVPNMGEFGLLNFAGRGHLNFTPIAPMTGDDAVKMFELGRGILHRHGFDHLTEFIGTWRALINLVMVMFDQQDAGARKRADACAREVILSFAEAGYGELKANLEYMDLVQQTYGYGDGAVRRLSETIKDALDPNGILSPGKQGIWPASMRKQSGKQRA